ncbi:hypothetical protein [Citreimonas salinaria]|uniref:Curlin associated repeat-containing protein n=1 Tax=Citreimonas salinaria TaxID=321339 RepID=A0A1H3N6U3_9RHOB|nr:hypothetical protein [Citreimonas salinaria]SDY83939.1 hypothetical protein SAMN05444340_12035 [Citreimonas salinaria]
MKSILIAAVALPLSVSGAFAQNLSVVDQFGYWNEQVTAQSGANTSVTFQDGWHNDAATLQVGENTSVTTQVGAFNNSLTEQYGANFSATVQAGAAGHISDTRQVGGGNASMTVQTD